MTQRCPSCGLSKDLSEFPRNRSTKSGRATYSKPCHSRITRANTKARYGSQRAFLLRLRYGTTEEELERLLAAQDGLCAICGAPDPEHVDHDHRTRKVRGLLCFNCNRAIGYFEDDVRDIWAAVDYLQEKDPAAPKLVDLIA